MNFKIISAVCALTAIFGTSASAGTLITFDDFVVTNDYLPRDVPSFTVQGFVFSGFGNSVINVGGPIFPFGAHSGDYAAINTYSANIIMTKAGGGSFTLDSFFIKGWANQSANSSAVAGSLSSVVVGSLIYNIGTTYNQVLPNFGLVDSISFLDLGYPGNLVLLDDVLIDSGSRGGVPEPATWAMMLVGFGGIGAVLRRRRAPTAPLCRDSAVGGL